MPVRDAVAALEIVRVGDVRWIGPSTPGLAIPGKLKLGFLPDVSLAPGPLGIMPLSHSWIWPSVNAFTIG